MEPDNKINRIFQGIKTEVNIFTAISVGVFLFILFFQPFTLDTFDFNNRLIFVAGMAAILFFFIILIRVSLPILIQKNKPSADEPFFPKYFEGFGILALSSVASAFYLRYVGQVGITFHIMFKVVLLCSSATVALWVHDTIRGLRLEIISLHDKLKQCSEPSMKQKDNIMDAPIVFTAENNMTILKIKPEDVLFIRSADNYVEIMHKEGAGTKKELIRNTLRNMEYQVRSYPSFIRCHRICIVNINCIEKLQRNYGNHSLTIAGYAEEIPVSRQYLLSVKEHLEKLRDE